MSPAHPFLFFSFLLYYYGFYDQTLQVVLTMPNLLIPIPHTQDAISRRVAKSIIDKVIDISSMDKRARVEIRGENQKAVQPGSEITDTELVNRFEHDGRVIVSFRETYVDSEIINSEVRHPYAQPVFHDLNTGVLIKPIYSNTNMELNFVYRAKSKQEALAWRDDVKVRMADNRQSHLHEAEYHLPIPVFCSRLLMHIHSLRENVAGYGDTLGEYLKRFYTKRAGLLSNQAGDIDNTLLVVAEKQLGIQGWFDFDIPPEEEKNEDGPSYLIQFNYQFSYMKPVEFNVVYPQVIHNQLLSPDFLTVKPKIEDPLQLPTYKSSYRFALDHFDYAARVAQSPLGGLHIPDYDEWIPANVLPYTTSLITWLVAFSPEDRALALGEEDILDTGFLADVLTYMKQNGPNMLSLGRCALHIGLFRNDEPVEDGALEFIPTERAFEIRTKQPVDLRKTYHIRLSFCTNIARYTDAALNDLHLNGVVALYLFQTVVNRLDVEHAASEYLDSEGRLSITFIKKFFSMLYHQRIGNAKLPGSGLNNDQFEEDSWFDNDSDFHRAMDHPYVQYLTIIAGSRNEV
jgi:hypothetical protein